MMHTHVAESVL